MSEKRWTPTRQDHQAETDRWPGPTAIKVICLGFSRVKGLALDVQNSDSCHKLCLMDEHREGAARRNKDKVPLPFTELDAHHHYIYVQ